jgi:hypothetical protein
MVDVDEIGNIPAGALVDIRNKIDVAGQSEALPNDRAEDRQLVDLPLPAKVADARMGSELRSLPCLVKSPGVS